MEGLRGFAVLLVFLVHYESLVHPWIAKQAGLLAVAESIKSVGHAGVQLFFLLSGYLIYRSLIAARQSFSKFILRRLRRIYPAFTAVFVVYVVLSLLGNMSYSYYLLHGLALKGGFMLLAGVLPPTGEQPSLHWWLLPPMLVLTLIPSAALFLLIERPSLLAPRERPQTAPVTAVAREPSGSLPPFAQAAP